MNAPFPKPPWHVARGVRAWAEAQPRGRFERVAGEVVGWHPSAPRKPGAMRAWRALDAACARPVSCQAFGDGMTVESGKITTTSPTPW